MLSATIKYKTMHIDDIGFVIMQIGNAELDNLYDLHISKAIEDSGLKPIRSR